MKREESDFKLRPGRPRIPKPQVEYTRAFRGVLAAAKRAVDAAAPKRKELGWASNFQQRCVVKLSFSRNKGPGPTGNPGQWAAHGSYIARASATQEKPGNTPGFDLAQNNIDPKELLGAWQKADDSRMFKIVISPELGHRVDLKQLTRELMAKIEQDLRAELHQGKLEWVGTVHKNTHQPHVHVALRGLAGGREFRIPKGYIKQEIRRHAQDYCTRQLGYRTMADAALGRQLKEADIAAGLVPPAPTTTRTTPGKERS